MEMRLHKSTADVFIPDGLEEKQALSRTTHLCIAAHPDDIEIMAFHGIASCYRRAGGWFTGIVVTNGSGSPRNGAYTSCSDEELKRIRRKEQRKAAAVGEYGAMIQLDYSSLEAKGPARESVVDDLVQLLEKASPRTVYLHNPADKHETHIAVLLRSLTALRSLPRECRPVQAYGCEIWRSLDWMRDEDKSLLPVSLYPNIAIALVGLFDSQIGGGKRYDLATEGRRRANATYLSSHSPDEERALTFAMDLSPLVRDEALSLSAYTLTYIDRFRDDVRQKLERLSSDG